MLTSEQIRAARAMLRIEQRDLADRSGVSLETIKRIERIPGAVSAYTSTMAAIQRALEEGGIEFTNSGQPGVRLRNPVAAPAASPVSASKAAASTKPAPRKKAATKADAGKPRRPAKR
jgi:transcriptional regulator with XRE-family HTH domain